MLSVLSGPCDAFSLHRVSTRFGHGCSLALGSVEDDISSHSDLLSAEFLERQRRSLLSPRAGLLSGSKNHESEESPVNEEAAGGPREYEEDGQKLAALELAGNLVVRDVARLARIERALIPHDRLLAVPDAVCTFDEEAAYELRQPG